MALGMVALGLLVHCVGCHSTGDLVQLPAHAGASVNQAADIQAQNAAADDFVIYMSEWLNDSPVLGPFGKRHLERIAKCLPGEPHPVIIEPTGNADVDRARREAIVTVLVMRNIPDADRRVVIDYPKAEGLFGDEAEKAYEGLINPQGAGRGGAGGFGGNASRRHIGQGSWWSDMFGGRNFGSRSRSWSGW
jgi:hypothetical protein